jgi:hypothetical protein
VIACGYTNGIKVFYYNAHFGGVLQTVTVADANVRYVTGVALTIAQPGFDTYVVGNGLGSTGTFLAKFDSSHVFSWIVFSNDVTQSYGSAMRPVIYYPLTDIVYSIASLSNGTMILSGFATADGSLLSQGLVLPSAIISGVTDATFAPNAPCGALYIQYHAPVDAVTNVTRICF